jgi:hypothetical protein
MAPFAVTFTLTEKRTHRYRRGAAAASTYLCMLLLSCEATASKQNVNSRSQKRRGIAVAGV